MTPQYEAQLGKKMAVQARIDLAYWNREARTNFRPGGLPVSTSEMQRRNSASGKGIAARKSLAAEKIHATRRVMVLDYLRDHETMTIAAASALFERTPCTARKALYDLHREGVLTVTLDTDGTKCFRRATDD